MAELEQEKLQLVEVNNVLQQRIASLEAEVKQWEHDSAGVPQMKERLRQREQECAEMVCPCLPSCLVPP